MACFIVPAAEAVVSLVVSKVAKSKEKELSLKTTDESVGIENSTKIPFSRKLSWLTKLLFGGSVLLAFEHLWHGEVVPWFPFLTAASDPVSTAEMLHEMATVGVSMAVLCTIIWVGMLVVAKTFEKRAVKDIKANA